MKKHGLRKKIIISVLICGIVFAAVASTLMGVWYYSVKMEEYKEIVYGYLKSASDFIDGDRLKQYIGDGEPDEYYRTVLDYITYTRNRTNIDLLAVFVPYEDDLEYIWLAADGTDSYGWLHKRESYMEGGKETRDATFRKDPVEKIKKYDYEGRSIVAGFYPIFDSNGEPVALLDVDLYTPDIQHNIMVFLFMLISLVAALIIATMIVVYRMMKRGILDPITKLSDASKQLVDNLDSGEMFECDIHTKDEIEELGHSFEKMDRELRTYIAENARIAAEKERIGVELGLAAQIQNSMLSSDFPVFSTLKEFRLHATMNPAKEVGGDFYDFFMVDEDHLALVIADVSGKGVPAAMFMTVSMVMLRSIAMTGVSPQEVLEKTNDWISEKNENSMFVTVWIGILELSTGKLMAANAGHENPILKRADGKYEEFEDAHGFVIGGLPGMKYEGYEITLQKDDVLFVYTDGLPEGQNESGMMFEVSRIIDTLNDCKQDDPKVLLSQMTAAVDRFVGEAEQFDDLTMLAVRY